MYEFIIQSIIPFLEERLYIKYALVCKAFRKFLIRSDYKGISSLYSIVQGVREIHPCEPDEDKRASSDVDRLEWILPNQREPEGLVETMVCSYLYDRPVRITRDRRRQAIASILGMYNFLSLCESLDIFWDLSARSIEFGYKDILYSLVFKNAFSEVSQEKLVELGVIYGNTSILRRYPVWEHCKLLPVALRNRNYECVKWLLRNNQHCDCDARFQLYVDIVYMKMDRRKKEEILSLFQESPRYKVLKEVCRGNVDYLKKGQCFTGLEVFYATVKGGHKKILYHLVEQGEIPLCLTDFIIRSQRYEFLKWAVDKGSYLTIFNIQLMIRENAPLDLFVWALEQVRIQRLPRHSFLHVEAGRIGALDKLKVLSERYPLLPVDDFYTHTSDYKANIILWLLEEGKLPRELLPHTAAHCGDPRVFQYLSEEQRKDIIPLLKLFGHLKLLESIDGG